jgi:hypothetical protein
MLSKPEKLRFEIIATNPVKISQNFSFCFNSLFDNFSLQNSQLIYMSGIFTFKEAHRLKLIYIKLDSNWVWLAHLFDSITFDLPQSAVCEVCEVKNKNQ